MSASVIAISLVGVAAAQPKPAPLVGATELVKLTTPTGFIDDVVAGDGDRLAYVVADTATKAELHVVTMSTKQEHVIDLAQVTLYPIALELVGQRVFVVGKTEDGKQIASLVDLAEKTKGKPIYKIAPATHITVITQDGKQRVAIHRVTAGAASTRHDVELLAIENGARLGARSVELATGDVLKALDFRVNHWSQGWTRAHGIKGGEWDKKEDQRSPDVEATYDVLAGKLVDRKKIDDLFDQRRRFQALAKEGSRLDFVRLGYDNKSLQLWRAGKPRSIELDQPFDTYDSKSLQAIVAADGSAWIALEVDPVNAEAVARKKADIEYLDIFRVAPDATGATTVKAVRKARVLAHGIRHRFGAITAKGGERFWLIERNQSMERGGKSLTVYTLP